MKGKIKSNFIKQIVFLCFVMILSTTSVEAKVQSYHRCFTSGNQSGLYVISWDDKINTEVTKDKTDALSLDEVLAKQLTAPTGTTAKDLVKYQFSIQQLSSFCIIDTDGSIRTCPTSQEYERYDIADVLKLNKDNEYENVEMEFNESTGKYNLKIKNIFKTESGQNGIKIRFAGYQYVDTSGNTTSNLNKNDGTKKGSEFSGFLTRTNSQYTLNNLTPSTKDRRAEAVLEFYLDDPNSICRDTYLATINLAVDNIESVYIKNPALIDPTFYACDIVKNQINNWANQIQTDSADTKTQLKSMFRNYVPYCFSSSSTDKIPYTLKATLKSQIDSDYKKLQQVAQSLISGGATTSTVTGTICATETTSVPKIVIAQSGRYWNLICTESYKMKGDNAKLVNAGEGFDYKSKFTIERNCYLMQTNKPSKPAGCNSSCSVSCTYEEIRGTVTNGHGGPSEDFDLCVTACDDGAYTQACINSCYKKVYGNTTDRDFSKLSYYEATKPFEDNFKVQRTEVIGTINNTAGCNYTHTSTDGRGNPKDMYSCHVQGSHCSIDVTFSTYCDTHNGQCVVNEDVWPAGCVDNPDAIYYAEISASNNELNDFKNMMTADNMKNGDYTITVVDSYLKERNNSYQYIVKTQDKAELITNVAAIESCTPASATLGHDSYDPVDFCSTKTIKKEITVELAPAYKSKVTNKAIYEVAKNKYAAYKTTTDRTTLETITFDKKQGYNDGRKYYTNMNSESVNVNIPEKYSEQVTLMNNNYYYSNANPGKKAGITVKVENLGTGNYTNQINCYYGVYKPPGDGGDCVPNVENGICCDNGSNTACPSDPPPPSCIPDEKNGICCKNGEQVSCPPPTCIPDEQNGICCNDDGLRYECQTCDEYCCGDECPDGDPSGITFVYRTIDLDDVFPNDRYPRWNWTNGAYVGTSSDKYHLLNYTVNPDARTANIESKGYEIYKDANEVDYNITLTPQNIQKIRNYNKNVSDINQDGNKNYLDYDMSCITRNGRDYCISKFLDNANADYVTYAGGTSKVTRQDIAKCNNAYNGQCVSENK